MHIMKNLKIFFIVASLFLSLFTYGQLTDPGDGAGGVGGAPGPVGGGAPIGSGLISLILLGSAYGLKKTYLSTISDRRSL